MRLMTGWKSEMTDTDLAKKIEHEHDYYKLTEEDNECTKRLREMFKEWQCDTCKKNGPGACSATEANARAYIEMPDGSRKYFCQIGCLLMQLSDHDMHAFILSQFDNVGDYLRNAQIPYLTGPVNIK
jgi:hypothetical protein